MYYDTGRVRYAHRYGHGRIVSVAGPAYSAPLPLFETTLPYSAASYLTP